MCAIAADAAAQSQRAGGTHRRRRRNRVAGRANFGTSDATETTPGGGGSDAVLHLDVSSKARSAFRDISGSALSERLEGRVIRRGVAADPEHRKSATTSKARDRWRQTDSILQCVIGGRVLWCTCRFERRQAGAVRGGGRGIPASAPPVEDAGGTGQLVSCQRRHRMFSSRADSRLKGYGLEEGSGSPRG